MTKVTLNDIKKQFGVEVEKIVVEIINLNKLEWIIQPIILDQQNDQQRVSIVTEQHGLEERRAALQRMFLLAIDETKNEILLQGSNTIYLFQKREKQIENLVRMFIAATNDVRAIIIKLADRLHSMQCILRSVHEQPDSIHQENSRLFAKITLAVYAPLADRLGIWQLKSRIEDTSFQFLNPDKFDEINEQFALKEEERGIYITQTIIPTLEDILSDNGIQAEISGRAKHIYSIYQKMERKQLTKDEINDLVGVRIIVNSLDDCYETQAIIHTFWEPLTKFYQGKIGRDWVVNPKENLYQSLHTAIQMNDKVVEVQIRTQDMHRIAEYGATAAHWRYKESKESKTYKKGKNSS